MQSKSQERTAHLNPLHALNLRRPIISSTRFNSHVILPQIFVFVALMVVGSLQGVALASVLQRCLVLTYLFATSLMIRGKLPQLSLKFCIAHLGALGLLLGVSSCALKLDALQAFQLPFAAMMIVFATLNLSFLGAGTLAISALGIFFVSELVSYMPALFAGRYGISQFFAARLLGWYVVFAASGALILLSLVRKANLETQPSSDESDLELVNQASYSERVELSQETSAQEPRAFGRAMEFVVGEIRSTFFWRLAIFGLLSSLACIWLLSFPTSFSSELVVSWLAVSALYCLLLRGIHRTTNVRDFYLSATVTAVCALLWWCMVWLRESSLDSLYLLCIGAVLVLSLPWPGRQQLALIIIYAMCGFLEVFWGALPPWGKALLAVTLCWSIYRGSEQRITRAFQTGQKLMRLMIESTPTATLVLRMMAWYFRIFFQTTRIMVMQSDSKSGLNAHGEIVSNLTVAQLNEQEIFVRGLLSTIDDSIRREYQAQRDSDLLVGIVPFSNLGEQFVLPALGWFGFLPKNIAFVRLLAPRGEREAWAWIIIPLSSWSSWWWRRLNLMDIRGALRELCTVPRLYFATTRSRVRSADELSASERAASRRDAELNEVVHVVNNCVQEITAACDRLAQVKSDQNLEFSEAVEHIERTALVLGSSVSDVRVLNELSATRAPKNLLKIPLHRLIDEILPSARYLSERKGVAFKGPGDPIQASVNVADTDLAPTALRLALSIVLSRARRSGTLELRFEIRSTNQIQLLLCDDFTESYESVFGGGASEGFVRVRDNDLRMRLMTLDNFMGACGGTIRFLHQTDWLPHRAVLTFQGAVEVEAADVPVDAVDESAEVSGGWILLVDDNPQMTDFYARIAEALELSFATADSLKNAREILEKRGSPQILVTDVQLGDGSGLELVSECRDKFGADLPVIVVSGEVGLASDTLKVGQGTDPLTRVLSKPVSRRRLFDEMKNLLAIKRN